MTQFQPRGVQAIFNAGLAVPDMTKPRKTQTRRIRLPHNLKRHLVKHDFIWIDETPINHYESSLLWMNDILAKYPYSECVCPGRGKPAAMWRGDNLQMYTPVDTYSGAAWKEHIAEFGGYQPLRITYTHLRYEPLQAITYGDIQAEGIRHEWYLPLSDFRNIDRTFDEWIKVWDSINSRPGLRWRDNPWVWVLQFRANNGGER